MKTTTFFNHDITVLKSDMEDGRYIVNVDGTFVDTKVSYTEADAIRKAKDYIRMRSRNRRTK